MLTGIENNFKKAYFFAQTVPLQANPAIPAGKSLDKKST